jgi:CBS domain-containing protein
MAFVSQVLSSKPGEVWTIEPDATVYQALQLMAEKNVGALPVVENGQLVGMFSERDYARRVILVGKSSRLTTVRELMISPVISVGPDATMEACMELMTERHIRHLPVLDAGRLIGIVSSGDVLKAVVAGQQVMINDLHNFITGGRS